MTEQQNTPDQPIPSQAEAAPNDAELANDALPSVEAQLLAAQAEAASLRDEALRARAEMENVRRRAEEEVTKARKFAVESFAENLLPVIDSLEAAAADKSGDVAKLQEGVALTLRQLISALERSKVSVIDPGGAKFDPHQHQAISMVPADQEANTVVPCADCSVNVAKPTPTSLPSFSPARWRARHLGRSSFCTARRRLSW